MRNVSFGALVSLVEEEWTASAARGDPRFEGSGLAPRRFGAICRRFSADSGPCGWFLAAPTDVRGTLARELRTRAGRAADGGIAVTTMARS
jgi:hypothetical protein